MGLDSSCDKRKAGKPLTNLLHQFGRREHARSVEEGRLVRELLNRAPGDGRPVIYGDDRITESRNRTESGDSLNDPVPGMGGL